MGSIAVHVGSTESYDFSFKKFQPSVQVGWLALHLKFGSVYI